jgi:lactate dehydrogenase-like 2-hydroxyacid dehydrogenase
MPKKPEILAVGKIAPYYAERLRSAFSCHPIPASPLNDSLSAIAPQIRGIAGTGESVISRALLDRLPAVQIISICGVGYDGVDVPAARERGIIVTHTPNVLNDEVANLGFGLLLSVARAIPEADRFVRAGGWSKGAFHFGHKVSGARLGIVGLGRIGRAIARRAEAFGMEIAYCGRRPVADVAYPYYDHPAKLASRVDFLVVICPGGTATRGLIDAEVLAALGPEGFLINISRGSVVDEDALVAALEAGQIAGAGLDVFVDEPNVPAGLLGRDNVVLTPHIGSATTATRQAMADLAFDNLDAHFSGRPVLTPISSEQKP